MKKKGNLDAIDPYLMIGIEGMLLCEYSEEQILSHFRQILKKGLPAEGPKGIIGRFEGSESDKGGNSARRVPALLLDILRASGWSRQPCERYSIK